MASIAVVALAVTGAVGLASSPVVAATAPVIASFTITGGPTLNLVKDDIGVVELTVRITCAVADGCNPDLALPGFLVYRGPVGYLSMAPCPEEDIRRFVRVSGDNSDGTYRMSLAFASRGASGSIRFDRFTIGNAYREIPLSAQARTITVNSRDPVIIRNNADPGVVGQGTLRGRLSLSFLVATRDSGRVRPGAAVHRVAGCDGGTGYGYSPWLTTTSSGFTPVDSSRTAYFDTETAFGYAGAYVRTLTIGGVTSDYIIDQTERLPTIQSRPSVTWANARASVTSIAAGQRMTLSGSVGGNGSPTRPNTVIVQRWVGGKWTNLGRALLLVNGRWSYVTAPRSLGVNQYRVVKPTNACSRGVCYSPNATSGTVRVTVR